jgi:hypothetical protein
MILSTSLLTSFDPTWLFLSIIPSAVGFVLFRYGKKQQSWPQMVAGLLFMVYPYFTPSTLSLIATGAVIGLGLWVAIRLDW